MTTDPAKAHSADHIGAEAPRTRAWHDGKVEAEGFPVADVSEYIGQGLTVWLDLCDPGRDDLHVISEELDLDPVAVEDAVSAHERAKLDRYHGYLFLNLYVPHVDGGELTLHEVSVFVTDHALVTVRTDRGLKIDALMDRWDDGPELGEKGFAERPVSALLYGLLDLVVDAQLDAAQKLDDEADELEELIFDESFPVRRIQQRSFRLRKNLAALRRVTLPMREILNTLLRRDLGLVTKELTPYYQDVYDHTLRVAEWTDGLRDLVANLLDTRIALQGNRMNEVMKKVTSWAAIIAVPTAVTGFYGQNVPYPGYSAHSGFVVSSVVIVLLSVGLYLVFKKRDWL
ncbi:magnesium transporter CorA family protein [Actinomadura parmotrematis]|uniref:Magnesium transporter CorA family protein n=1 Tax=Actinomadura parmotrematis TaxID=2864039 RepID=A0ABS7FMP9_9ACTN|nr:magnesium transporter CorA family protein [Actinomadura parmotrematis]MBW8481655.1 magnesium transporter CorA family protein [Actinomadura parmotrematis]